MPSELLTVQEAAQRLKVNPQTVRRWARIGLLPAAKAGRKEWRISAADLESHFAAADAAHAQRRSAAVETILALRERLRNRGISVSGLIAESRGALERRGAPRRR